MRSRANANANANANGSNRASEASESNERLGLGALPYVGDEIQFAPLPKRVESVLVTPKGVVANGRPSTHTVLDA